VGTADGTYVNGVTLGSAGTAADGDPAAGFDGTDDHVDVGDVFDFPGTAPFSAEFWIRIPDTAVEGWQAPVSTGTLSAPRQGWQFWLAHDTSPFGIANVHTIGLQRWRDGTHDPSTSTTQLAAGVWYHIAGTYDGATIRLYVNGHLEHSRSSTLALLPDAAPLRFGGVDAGFLQGDLDEVAIYDHALDPDRVRAHARRGDAYRALVLGDRPGGYWRLGETGGSTAADELGGAGGTYQGGVTSGALGRTRDGDRAAVFDGTGAGVTLGDRFDFPATAAFSVEAWVRPADVASDFGRLVAKESDVDPRQGWKLMLQQGTNRVLAERWHDDVNDTAQSTTALRPHVWYHVAATYDGALLRLYVDGTLEATAASTRPLLDLAEPLRLGSRAGLYNHFHGTLDDVAVYPHVLSAAQIQAHHAAGGSTCGLPGTFAATADRDSTLDESTPATNPPPADLLVRSAAGADQRALVHAPLPHRPAGCDVTAAALRLTAASSTAGRTLEAAQVAADWTETGVTWAGQPPVTGTAATATSGPTVLFDVARAVRDQYAGVNHGFLVRDAAEDDPAGPQQVFLSREAAGPADRPQLTVTLG
jgi:hypothetical protein